jgi:cation diffusion facilitator CzcD-associated flavoprotein CzcO
MKDGITGRDATHEALIIGAGFSGLYQLHALRERLGLHAEVLEAADDIGGTWYWNRYPGARCDSESHSYCYTFSDELVREWEWSERYPDHNEIRRYLAFVADRLDLRRSIRLGTRVIRARHDPAANLWRVTTQHGEELSAQFLIAAVGCLSAANVPAIPGLEAFEGKWYHTGQWPHDGVNFTGKRVGLVGTGSTGIQAAPEIAKQAAHLTVFQRTANYSVPAQNAPLTPEFRAWLRENFDEVRRLTRSTHNGHPFQIEDRSVFDVTDEEREEIFEQAWARGGLQFRAAFRDILSDVRANEKAADFLKRKIRQIVKDPEKARLLSDIDHPYAAKRPPIDTDYFETFNRDNVSLVDVRAAPIEAVTPSGIRTSQAEYPLDVIVFATGFDAMTGALLRVGLEGPDGTTLREVWANGPLTYLGLGVPGFPNLFTVTGPGSPSVLCNMPVPIEQHVEWITRCIAQMRAEGLASIEPTREAAEEWMAEVTRAAEATLLPQAASSWYLGANVPGKPRVFMPYAGGMVRYREICDEVAAKGYAGFRLARAPATAAE